MLEDIGKIAGVESVAVVHARTDPEAVRPGAE